MESGLAGLSEMLMGLQSATQSERWSARDLAELLATLSGHVSGHRMELPSATL